MYQNSDITIEHHSSRAAFTIAARTGEKDAYTWQRTPSARLTAFMDDWQKAPSDLRGVFVFDIGRAGQCVIQDIKSRQAFHQKYPPFLRQDIMMLARTHAKITGEIQMQATISHIKNGDFHIHTKPFLTCAWSCEGTELANGFRNPRYNAIYVAPFIDHRSPKIHGTTERLVGVFFAPDTI